MLQGELWIFNMAIGANIKRLRRDKKWTQGDLSDKSGVKIGHISKLERDESDPKLSTITKLINALECSPNALLSEIQDIGLNSLVEIGLERVQRLPDAEKNHLLDVIDKYCIAVSLQGLVDESSKTFMGIGRFSGATEELSKKQ